MAEQVRTPSIRSVADVTRDRKRREFQAGKALCRRILHSTLKCKGIPDVASDTLLPRGLHVRAVLVKPATSRAARTAWAHCTDQAGGHQPARGLPLPGGALCRATHAVTNGSQNKCQQLKSTA
jgi:hypothetical protein